MTQAVDERVVLGGRVAGYQGRMPGIAEESLCSLRAEQPLYGLGGFGGCVGDIAESLKRPRLTLPVATPCGLTESSLPTLDLTR